MAKKQSYFKQQYIAMQESWSDGIKTKKQRILAHIDAHIGDHAFFRVLWKNLYQLDDLAWRSNQPSPKQVKSLADLGIKDIVNLRGPSRWGSYILEKEACEKYGINFINHRMYSRRMPTYEELLATQAMFNSLDGPVLFHCKSGADRAGMCATLYSLMVKKQPVEEATKQLSFKYLHIKHSKTGRLDYFFETYQKFNEHTPIDFMDWAENHYDRDTLTNEFHSNKWYDFFVDKVLNRE
jgi:protein tyrosine/serine phosphatase